MARGEAKATSLDREEGVAASASGTIVDRLIGIVDRLGIGAAWLAGLCLVALTLLMLAQIAVAAVSRLSPAIRGDIPVVWEYGSYLMGATFMLGLAMTLRAGRHIRLGLLTDNANPRVRRTIDIIVSLIGLVLAGFLTYSLGRGALNSMLSGSTSIASRTPLWVPLSVFAAGCLLLTLQFTTRILAGVTGRPVEDPSLQVGSSETE